MRPVTLEKQVVTAKFIQIASGQPIGAGLIIIALADDGSVWWHRIGRDDEWHPLPKERGRPASL